MAEPFHVHETGLPAHIHSADSITKRNGGQLLALIPVFMAACFAGHAEILRVLLISLVSAVTFEFIAAKFLRKKENLRNGEAVTTAALFSLLVPSRCPSEVVILGIFIAVFVAKGLFGGTGSYLLHPLFLARVFLQYCYPKIMTEPMLLVGEGDPWTLIALGWGGIFLLKQRKGYWETPVLFMAGCFICEAVFGGQDMLYAFFSGVLLTAFFLLADPVTLPLTRPGTAIFILGAALLSSRLGPEGFSIRSAAFAVLTMNLFTPFLDIWLKPVPYKTRSPLKATYPL